MLSQLYKPHEGGDCVLLYSSFLNKHSVFFLILIIEQTQPNDELIVASCTERLVESFFCSLGNTSFVSLWAPGMDVLE